jgi:hypothetical protein
MPFFWPSCLLSSPPPTTGTVNQVQPRSKPSQHEARSLHHFHRWDFP